MNDFRRVRATDDAVAAHVKRHNRKPVTYRVQCTYCGRVIWGSGLGVGSHRRACERVHVLTTEQLDQLLTEANA